jgi:hypothetical protein
MILHMHSDASYLSVSNACSHLGGLFFCGDTPPKEDTFNGSILNVVSVINSMVASADESDVGACFHNAQIGAPLRVTLTELGHTQPATQPRTKKATAFGILNETMKQKSPNEWTWGTIGPRIESVKNNLTCIGDHDVRILATITQNIIKHNITKIYTD